MGSSQFSIQVGIQYWGGRLENVGFRLRIKETAVLFQPN